MRRLRKITGGIGRSFQPLSDGYLETLGLFCMRSMHSLELGGYCFLIPSLWILVFLIGFWIEPVSLDLVFFP